MCVETVLMFVSPMSICNMQMSMILRLTLRSEDLTLLCCWLHAPHNIIVTTHHMERAEKDNQLKALAVISHAISFT